MLVTNDLDTGTADIYESVLDGRIAVLEPGQSLADLVRQFKDTPLVIDFGAFVEARVIEAARMADITIVPLCYQSTADLMPAVKTILALQAHTKEIVLLINNTHPEHVEDLKNAIDTRFPNLPILVVSPSRYINRLADDGLTVQEIAALGGLESYQLRNILPQVEALYALLDRHSTHNS